MSSRNIILGQETPLGKRELASWLCQNMIPTEREVVLQGQIMGRVNEVLHEGRQFLWVEKLTPQPSPKLGGGEAHPPAPSPRRGGARGGVMSSRNIILGQETPLGKRELASWLCQTMIPTEREVVLQGQIMGRVNEVLHEGRQFLWVEKLTPQPSPKLGGGETHPPAPSQAGRGSLPPPLAGKGPGEGS